MMKLLDVQKKIKMARTYIHRDTNVVGEIREDGTMFMRGKEVFYRPKENGYKEIKLNDGRIISGHLNSHGEIILREVPNQSLGRGSRITTGQHNVAIGYSSGFSSSKAYIPSEEFKENLIPTEDEAIVRKEKQEDHYALKPKVKEDIQSHIEKILKTICMNRGITFLSMSEKLVSVGSLMKWSPMPLSYDMNNPMNPQLLITDIINIINRYTPRIDSLSWEKQDGGKFVLYSKLI